MKICKEVKQIIEQEIDRLEKANFEMRKQIEHEINKNEIHIFALKELLNKED